VRSPDVDALHAQTQALDLLARSAVCLGRFDDAVAARREAVRVAEEPVLRETEQLSQARYYLAATLAESPNASLLAEANNILVVEQARLRARGEGDRLLSALNESILANLADAAGDVAQAETHFREALRIKRRLYGGDHAEIATTLCNYAHFLGRRDRRADCLAAFDEAIAMYQSIFGPTHERTSDAITRRAKWADGTWKPDGR
jgi:tetratricopeptide (TPR) repeat protein